MKAFEAFSSKDIRTCARILSLLEAKGLDLSDLRAHAAHMRFMGGKGANLVFRGVDLGDPDITDSVMEGIGWRTLRIWRKIKGIVDKSGKTDAEIRSFVRTERKRWLEHEAYGTLRP